MSEILITGANGQLGRSLLREARLRGIDARGYTHQELAVEDRAAVLRLLDTERPRHVIHAGAYTDVDGCERNPLLAQRCNAEGTAHLTEACVRSSARLIYVSTDFVFDGQAQRPYRHDDAPRPVSHYGTSKLCGELAVRSCGRTDFAIVRTSWVFGPGGKNFPKAIVQRARSGAPVHVVDDQRGRPTMTDDLAAALIDLAYAPGSGGIYHAANAGECNWHQFACEILAAVGLGHIVVGKINSAQLARPARRPAYSVLDCERLDVLRGKPMPDYHDALQRYLAQDPLNS